VQPRAGQRRDHVLDHGEHGVRRDVRPCLAVHRDQAGARRARLRQALQRDDVRVRQHVRAAAEPVLDLGGRPRRQRHDLGGARTSTASAARVARLIAQVRVLQVVHRHDQRDAEVAQGVHPGLHLGGGQVLEAEVDVHHVVRAGLLAQPGGGQDRRGPPLPGRRTGDRRVGEADDASVVTGRRQVADVRVARRDGCDAERGKDVRLLREL
jgi:hypothetical protein